MRLYDSTSCTPVGLTGSRWPPSSSGNGQSQHQRLLPRLSKLLGQRHYQHLDQRESPGPAAKQNIYKQPSNHGLLAHRAGSPPALQPSSTNSTGMLTDNTRNDDEAPAVPVRASFAFDNDEIYQSIPGLRDLEIRLNETLAKVKNDLVDAEDTEPSDTSSLTTLSSLGSTGSTRGDPPLEMGGMNSKVVCTTENQTDFTMFPDFHPEKQSHWTTKVESTHVATPIRRQDLNPWPVREINEEALLGQLLSSPGTSILSNGFGSNSPIKPTVVEDFRAVRAKLRKVVRKIQFGPSSMKSETIPQVCKATSNVTRNGATKEEAKASKDFPLFFSSQAVRTQEIRRHAPDPKAGLGGAVLPPAYSRTVIGTQNSAFKPIGPRKISTGFGGSYLQSPITLVGDKKGELPTQCQKREQPLQFSTKKDGDNGENYALTVVTSQTNRAVVMPPVKDEPQVAPIAPLMEENPMLVKCHNMKGSSLLNEKRQALQQQIMFPTKIYRGNGDSDVPPVLTSEVKRAVVAFPIPQEDAQQNSPRAIYEKKNVLAKYHNMKKIGIPSGAIQNAMLRDGVDPSLFYSEPGATKRKPIETKTSVPKDNYRRTGVHWEAHDGFSSRTVWAMIKRDPDVSSIRIDDDEFRNLFRSELGTASLPTTHKVTDHGAVKIINPKRANNGGIILARVKLSYDEIAQAIDTFDQDAMTPEQIRGILRFVPTDEERTALASYLRNSGSSLSALCECEKFMVSMMSVQHAKDKLQALLFMQGFHSNLEEIRKDARMVQKACDEIIFSSRFRKVLGIILALGNRLNAAGSSTKDIARAITIDSLTKLNQAKAFDQKTTFLLYVVKIIRSNNMGSLVPFRDEISNVFKAEKSHWDQSVMEMEKLEKELDQVRKIALHQSALLQPSRSEGDDSQTLVTASLSLSREVEVLQGSAVGRFTLDACLRMAVLVNEVENSKGHYNTLLRYFGEEDSTMRPDEVFKIISTFSKSIDIALDEVIDQEKAKMKELKGASNRLVIEIRPTFSSDDGEIIPGKPWTNDVVSEMKRIKPKSAFRWKRRKGLDY